MIQDLNRRLDKLGPSKVLILAAGWLTALIVLDVRTGVEIDLLTLYWLPAAFAAWYGGAYAGGVMVLASLAGAISQKLHDHPDYDRSILLWNTLIRGTSYAFLCAVLLKLKAVMTRETTIRREAQESAQRLRASTLEVMSREIDNAITVLETAVYMMKQRGGSTEGWGPLERVLADLKTASRRFLDRARKDSARISERLEKVNLREKLEAAAASFRALSEQRGLKLRVNAPELRVWADEAALSLVLSNLLSNSIKYSKEGGSVTLGAERGAEDGAPIVVRVTDEGDGIPEDRLNALNSSAGSAEFDEGIRMVRDLLRLHNSLLAIESAPGKGSSFSFELTEVSERKAGA